MNAFFWSGLIILVSAGCAIFSPLTTYAISLATFGIAHVAIELRYIDSRFHLRFGDRLELQLLGLVLAIACLRGAIVLEILPAKIAYLIELSCGLGLITIATYRLWLDDWLRGLFSLVLGCLLGVGIIFDPLVVSSILAIGHNLTPIGFILERQQVKDSRSIWWCGLIFGAMPIAILLIRSLLGWQLPEVANLSYLSAFIAPAWQKLPIVYPLFSAIVFWQCMHYAAVIGLLSQWTNLRAESWLSWLSAKYFYLLIGGVSIAFFIAFQHSFVATRAYYSIVASVHAWIEIPLLLLLLQPRQQHADRIGAEVSTEG